MDSGHLLLIDDDVKFSRLLSGYLRRFGYIVDSVQTGQQGIASAVTGRYEVVILDVMLPNKNGWDVLRELRRESNVPVLMLTALGDEPDRTFGLQMGASDYLPKTLSMRALLERLRQISPPALE